MIAAMPATRTPAKSERPSLRWPGRRRALANHRPFHEATAIADRR
jgi:hypothetical protein